MGGIMYQCILWGDGRDYDQYINAVRYQELSGNIQVIGITSKATIYRRIDGYAFIHKSQLGDYDFDLLIIMSVSHLEEIQLEAAEMGISEERILSCEVFSLPNLDLDKYLEIKKRNLTIFEVSVSTHQFVHFGLGLYQVVGKSEKVYGTAIGF